MKPPLRRIHSEQTMQSGLGRITLAFWRTQPTEVIVASLLPGTPEALRVKADGRVMNGNTRLQVLEERGLVIDDLPREPVP